MSYAYDGEMYCDYCAGTIKSDLNAAGIEDSGDTNDCPQYVDSDEADCPHHCGDCDDFLENALTSDGYDYVREAVRNDIASDRTDSIAITVWAPYYDVEVKNPNSNCLDGMACPHCGSFGDFTIAVSSYALMNDDGVVEWTDADFDGDSHCHCSKCGYDGIVDDFRE